jgi:hypothetical protein
VEKVKKVARELINRMAQLTARKSLDLVMANAQLNQPYIKRTVLDLAVKPKDGASTIVVAAGPSLHRRNSVAQILDSGYTGTIICADGALGHCLRLGLVPDYVVTLDPHPTRIVRWFGDPDLTDVDEDDYFRRQDLDPYVTTEELARNRELVNLVNTHGPAIKGIISTSAAQRVTQRCLAAGMNLYWWNPLMDDFEVEGNLTEQLFRLNGAPCLATGGNGGSAAWVFAHAVLGIRDVALVGMDFSYPPGTPVEKTQYYREIVNIFGESASDAYIRVNNRHLGEQWFTDPAYYWYRQTFLDMALEASCNTFNCTEGGILFGRGVRFTSLGKFLASHQ